MNIKDYLKGHEGEGFYCLLCGPCIYKRQSSNLIFIQGIKTKREYLLDKDGTFDGGECVLFPSKEDRDWEKWNIENPASAVADWESLVERAAVRKEYYSASVRITNNGEECYSSNDPLEQSALAYMKIQILIDSGYGGRITSREWEDPEIDKYCILVNEEGVFEISRLTCRDHVAFHTMKQAERFLKYNKDLLKKYYMLD